MEREPKAGKNEIIAGLMVLKRNYPNQVRILDGETEIVPLSELTKKLRVISYPVTSEAIKEMLGERTLFHYKEVENG